jgi:hypothetical protein
MPKIKYRMNTKDPTIKLLLEGVYTAMGNKRYLPWFRGPILVAKSFIAIRKSSAVWVALYDLVGRK